MKKCLLFVRSSTDRQETQSQLEETRNYAITLGYDEFVVLERSGASAFKVSKKYTELVDELKDTLTNDKSIEAVVVFALNRLSRNPSKALEIEEFLVQNRIQLHCKTPELTLLNSDGSENEGAGLVFTIYSKISQLEIEELKLKSKRAKERDRKLKKFRGGRGVAFGYMVEDKFVIEDPDNSKIVNEIFDLYGTGEWSYHTLAEEVNERYGLDFNWHKIKNILHDKDYYDDTMYPPIITKEQYDKAAGKRDINHTQFKPKATRHFTFVNRIIRCPACGYGLTANVESYKCIHSCRDAYYGINNVDGLVWLIASHLEGERLLKSSAKEEYMQNKAVLTAKIKSVDSCTVRMEKVRQNLKKALMQGSLDADDYTEGIRRLESEEKETLEKVANWQRQIAELDRLINEDTMSIKRILDIADQIDSYTEQQMRDIVRKWVKRITVDGDVFIVETLVRTYKAVYRRYNWVSRWLTINGRPLAVKAVNRDKNGCAFGSIRVKPVDLSYTLAWLNGSSIV